MTKIKCHFRNSSKKFAFGTKHVALLVAKITSDCISKSLIGFSYVYTMGRGSFSGLLALKMFYSMFGVMFVFHFIFNRSPAKNVLSIRHWFGKNYLFAEHGFEQLLTISMYHQNTSGLTLNSLSSVLTYTDMPLVNIQGKKSGERENHMTTFIKQSIYSVIVLIIHIW